MGKGKNNKGNKELEKDLFAVENKNEEAVQMEEIKNQEEVVETGGVTEVVEESMEMEMELDGEEIQSEMEEIVSEKVKQEEKQNQEQKSKRGPKPLTDEEKAAKQEEKKEDKKEKALNLKDINIIQREIKKGRLSAPQGRIEKLEDGSGYILKLADGVIFPQDAKGNMKEIEKIAKMNDGKYIITNHAAAALNTEKFKAKHENGEEVEHDYVRVELHKPGRDKDVVELFTVKEAKSFLRQNEAVAKKKEEEAKKKAEKKAKEEAEKAAEASKTPEAPEGEKKEEQPTA